MIKTANAKAEQLKTAIDKNSRSYKETVNALVKANTGYLKVALDSNKTIIDSMQEKFYDRDVDHSVIDGVKKAMGSSVEMAESTIDTVIDSYNEQVESMINFNSKLVEMIKNLDMKYPEDSEMLMKLIQENIESSIQLSTDGMKKIVDAYNRNTNLAINFNKTFGQSINSQMEAVQKLQNRNMNVLTHWASEWIKQSSDEIRI